MQSQQAIEEALSSTRWVFEFIDQRKTPESVIAALCANISHIPDSSWEERLEFGGVFVNGERVYSDRALVAPVRLEYFEPKYDFRKAEDYFPKFDPSWILYDDNSLLAVFKPAGLPTIANKDQRRFHLKGYLETHFGHRVHLPSRLDSATGGLLLASKHPDFHGRLQRLFERHLIEKYYLAGVGGIPGWSELKVQSRIGRDRNHPVLRKTVESGGLDSETDFRRISCVPERKLSLLLAQPKTGRTHQIRVHCASLGFPIRGDRFYGGEQNNLGLQLLSFATAFVHPLSGKRLILTLPERLFPPWISDYSFPLILPGFHADIGVKPEL